MSESGLSTPVVVPEPSPSIVISAARATDEAMARKTRPSVPNAVAGMGSERSARATLVPRSAIASWYGPGFIGNTTACGQVLAPDTRGTAHRTLPCGTVLTLEHDGRMVIVTVIDRGPYVAGRELDLTQATRDDLGCPDLCPLTIHDQPVQ